MKMTKQKEFKEEKREEVINWETYKMKKDFGVISAIFLAIIWSFIAYSILKDFNPFNTSPTHWPNRAPLTEPLVSKVK